MRFLTEKNEQISQYLPLKIIPALLLKEEEDKEEHIWNKQFKSITVSKYSCHANANL